MKTRIIICDSCGETVDDKGAIMRLTYTDARRGAKSADLCGGCADQLPGEATRRRGRPRKSQSEEAQA